eukprot:10152338-Alexandrium_andersonii.AAC.1
MRVPLAIDADQRRIQVLRSTWAKGIRGAEEAVVGDIRNKYQWHNIARADIICMGLPCQSTSSAGRG